MPIEYTYPSEKEEVFYKRDWSKSESVFDQTLFDEMTAIHNNFVEKSIAALTKISGLSELYGGQQKNAEKYNSLLGKLKQAAIKEAAAKNLSVEEADLQASISQTNAGKLYDAFSKIDGILADLNRLAGEGSEADKKTVFRFVTKDLNGLLECNEDGELNIRNTLYDYLKENGYEHIEDEEFKTMEELCNALETVDQHAEIVNRQEKYAKHIEESRRSLEEVEQNERAVIEMWATFECAEDFKVNPETFDVDIKAADEERKAAEKALEEFDINAEKRLDAYFEGVKKYPEESAKYQALRGQLKAVSAKLDELTNGENGYLNFSDNYKKFLEKGDKEEAELLKQLKEKKAQYEAIEKHPEDNDIKKRIEENQKALDDLISSPENSKFYDQLMDIERTQRLYEHVSTIYSRMLTNPTKENFNDYMAAIDKVFVGDSALRWGNKYQIYKANRTAEKNRNEFIDKNDYQKLANEVNAYFSNGFTERIQKLAEQKNDLIQNNEDKSIVKQRNEFLMDKAELETLLDADRAELDRMIKEREKQSKYSYEDYKNDSIEINRKLSNIRQERIKVFMALGKKYDFDGQLIGTDEEIRKTVSLTNVEGKITKTLTGLMKERENLSLKVKEQEKLGMACVDKIMSEEDTPEAIAAQRTKLTDAIAKAKAKVAHITRCKTSFENYKKSYDNVYKKYQDLAGKEAELFSTKTSFKDKDDIDFSFSPKIASKLSWYSRHQTDAYRKGHENSKEFDGMTESIETALEAMRGNGSLESKMEALDELKDAAQHYLDVRRADKLVWGTAMRKSRLQFAESIVIYTSRTVNQMNEDLAKLSAAKEITENSAKAAKICISPDFITNAKNTKAKNPGAIYDNRGRMSKEYSDDLDKFRAEHQAKTDSYLTKDAQLADNGKYYKKVILENRENAKKQSLVNKKSGKKVKTVENKEMSLFKK